VPRDAARAYYEKNRTRFDTPVRVRLWRILCATRAEAQSVLDSIHRDPTPKTFGDLARDHSVDHGTSLRAGDLGFLTADGLSREPGLRVDPAVVRAALGVRDGDVVPSPVEEGAFFSVVWRRGTIPALHQTFDEVAAQIQETLRKDRVKAEADDLIASLRAAHLRDLDEARLDAPDLAPTEAPARGTRPDAQVDGGPNSP
jgi:peptidyl-prolyl cis-trans isomerase C